MYRYIVLPVDGSSTSDGGLEEAIKLAQVIGGRVRLLHVAGLMPLSTNAEGYGAVSSDVRRIVLEARRRSLRSRRRGPSSSRVGLQSMRRYARALPTAWSNTSQTNSRHGARTGLFLGRMDGTVWDAC